MMSSSNHEIPNLRICSITTIGFTHLPFSLQVICKCSPVLRPVLPVIPTMVSAETTSPLNGNLGKMAVTDSNITMAKCYEDAGTLVVANFMDDAWQHGEDFVAACM